MSGGVAGHDGDSQLKGVQVAGPVRWGIVSTANINRKVIPGAHASPKVELVAVASREQARAEAYAKEWRIERAYGSHQGRPHHPPIEAAFTSLPHTLSRRGSVCPPL